MRKKRDENIQVPFFLTEFDILIPKSGLIKKPKIRIPAPMLKYLIGNGMRKTDNHNPIFIRLFLSKFKAVIFLKWKTIDNIHLPSCERCIPN